MVRIVWSDEVRGMAQVVESQELKFEQRQPAV
jgi:hypothetical protein